METPRVGAPAEPRASGARSLFVTGASGLVGRALLARLDPLRELEVTCLSRSLTTAPQRRMRFVQGSLERPEGWRKALAGVDTLVHLAALTGKHRAADFERVNLHGTRALLQEAGRAGVRRFLFVSTIAAGFARLEHYPYARSKLAAEELVRAGPIPWGIARPTMVLGKRAPIWRSLASLAKLPVVPVFGDGRARVQPVHVDDLALLLADWIGDPSLDGQVLDLGGGEATTFEDLLRRAHRALKGADARVLHLPARAAIGILARLEPALLPLLPVTAGQLASFVNDSTARPNPLLERRRGELRGIDAMLRELAA